MGLFHRCSADTTEMDLYSDGSLLVRTNCRCGKQTSSQFFKFRESDWSVLGKRNGWTLGSSAPVSPPWGELLGVKPNATKAQVDKAHREIARIVHPDVGGTSHLMTLFNNAKDAAYKQLGFK